MTDKVLSLLGLAQKAGKVQSGEYSCEMSVKKGKAALVILAEDASDRTRKKFRNMCEFYETPLVEYGSRDQLGAGLGKEFRAMAALEDEGFASAVLKLLRK